MKKSMFFILTALLSLTFISGQLKAGTEAIPISTTKSNPVESAKVNALISRLNEIKAIDKSKLSSLEKKQLRKEVRETKSQLREIGGGVYLSVGAIIIIVLLLILLV
jgi:hypothetical protein